MRQQSKRVAVGKDYDVIGVLYGRNGRVSDVKINAGDTELLVYRLYYVEVEPWSHDYQI